MAIPATRANASHLLRRAAFGGVPEEVDAAVAAGIEATVERLLQVGASPPDTPPFAIPSALDQVRDPAGVPRVTRDLQAYWLGRMAVSPTPALEKLVLFWHGHFATSVRKVIADRSMWQQNQLFRRIGAGSFPALVKAVSRDPAMVRWLDLRESDKGAVNENFARELLELFTMGRDNGYTQLDVAEAARAFTGHKLDPRADLAFVFVPAAHDAGRKTFLGVSGNLGGDDIVDIVVRQPQTARFVASRLWFRYASATPPAGVLDDLAAAFARRLDVTDLLRALLTHPAFYGDDVRHGLVATPVEVFVRVVRALAWGPDQWGQGAGAPALLGQILFAPPNVGGWGHNGTWLGSSVAASRALVARQAGTLAVALARAGNQVCAGLRGSVGDADAFTSGVMGRLGVTEVSTGTRDAVSRYVAGARGQSTDRVFAGAVSLALVAPEAVLQ
ncbi:MAG: DUF1800 domain-containing protein [Acidimicrobiales bacterium]|nr:DUF1800 domain-containing protein [Acidimicrobiales bacterium]